MNPRKVITRVLALAAVLLVGIVGGAVAAFGVDRSLEAVELTVRGYDVDELGRIVERQWINDPDKDPTTSSRITIELDTVEFKTWWYHLEDGDAVRVIVTSPLDPCGDSECPTCQKAKR